jgi:hypothetical protein
MTAALGLSVVHLPRFDRGQRVQPAPELWSAQVLRLRGLRSLPSDQGMIPRSLGPGTSALALAKLERVRFGYFGFYFGASLLVFIFCKVT